MLEVARVILEIRVDLVCRRVLHMQCKQSNDLVEAVNCDKPELVAVAVEYILDNGSFVADDELVDVCSSFDDLQGFDDTFEDAFVVVLDGEFEFAALGDVHFDFDDAFAVVVADDGHFVLDDGWVVAGDNNVGLVGDIHELADNNSDT